MVLRANQNKIVVLGAIIPIFIILLHYNVCFIAILMVEQGSVGFDIEESDEL
jgi:hypothetical protein